MKNHSNFLIGVIALTTSLGFGVTPLTARAQVGPIVEPIDNDTTTQIETFYSENGGRAEFPQITQDVTEAFLAAEDAVVDGDYATARVIIDDILAQYPLSDGAWGGATYPSGLNLGRPAGYYGIRMLDEISRQGLANQGKESQPLTLTIITVACAEGFQPTNIDFTETREVNHTINSAITDSNHYVLRQGAQLLQQYVHALTSGERHLQLRFITEEETCAIVNSPTTGRWIGLNNTQAILGGMSDHVANSSDMYWLVYPSNIPEDSIFENYEFISSATNRFQDRMVFMMDDRWILKKPLHLGTGVTSEVERRMYHPQWMQHEYFHHLFQREFPEFELEKTSHQWFSAANWPEDFTRPPSREPDYYAEAVAKRFYDASPSVAERLSHSQFSDQPVKVYSESNYSGLAWGVDAGVITLSSIHQSAVGNDAISSIEIAQGYSVKLCLHNQGKGNCETYTTSTPELEEAMNNQASHIEVTFSTVSVAGYYERSPIQNNWHLVTLIEDDDGIWWTNEAGIRCELSWKDDTLTADESCPYGEREVGVVIGEDGTVTAIKLVNETYTLQKDSPALEVAGYYERSPIQNNWHLVTIVEDEEGIWWTNEAGIRCELSWKDDTLTADASCPYGEREVGVEVDQGGGVTAIRLVNETYTLQPNNPLADKDAGPIETGGQTANAVSNVASASGGGAFGSSIFLLFIISSWSLWRRRLTIKSNFTM